VGGVQGARMAFDYASASAKHTKMPASSEAGNIMVNNSSTVL